MPLKVSLLEAIPVQYENQREPDIDPELMPLSKCFTILFWVTCFSVVLGATLKFSLTRQREIVQIPDSSNTEALTYAEYLGIAQQNPVCPCSNPAIMIGSFANVVPLFFPLVTNLLELVNSPNASQAYLEYPELEAEFMEQSVAADLFSASKDAVEQSVRGLVDSAFIMTQLVPQKVVEQDLYARLMATRTAGSAALRNSIRSIFVWASFNLPYLLLLTSHDGIFNEPITLLSTNETKLTARHWRNINGSPIAEVPEVFIGMGADPTKGGFCASYTRGCDLFDAKLKENITSYGPSVPQFEFFDALCADPSNATAFAQLNPPYPVGFTQWCWVAGMAKFQEQPYPPNQRLIKWSDIMDTLTLYQINITVDHTVLFNSCAPVSCSYPSVHLPSAAQVVSYATSLYGGVASIAGSIYAALWAFKLKHMKHKRKRRERQDMQMAQLRATSQQLTPSSPTSTPNTANPPSTDPSTTGTEDPSSST